MGWEGGGNSEVDKPGWLWSDVKKEGLKGGRRKAEKSGEGGKDIIFKLK